MDQAGLASAIAEQSLLLTDIRNHLEWQSNAFVTLLAQGGADPSKIQFPPARAESRIGQIQWNDPAKHATPPHEGQWNHPGHGKK